MAGQIDLPDVNVWLAFAVASHPHHQRAHRYWYEESSEQLAFCRITALGFVRWTTHVTVMNGQPLTMPQAWRAYLDYRDLPEVLLAVEPEGCEAWLGRWATTSGQTPRQWTDAYLAAFAAAGGMRLVTFDRGFQQFNDLDVLLLTG